MQVTVIGMVVGTVGVVPSVKPYMEYRDNGCQWGVSCLRCPYPVCIEGESERGAESWLVEFRNEGIREMIRKGYSYAAVEVIFGVQWRTINRAIKGERDGG